MFNFVPFQKFARVKATGFTLVELLLVIAIMGVLTTMALAILRSAGESARVSATQARISRIEAILKAELERYEVRRLPISRDVLNQYVAANSALTGPNGVKLINLQRRLVQDLINCEMPRPILVAGSFQRNPDLGLFPSQQPADLARPLSSFSNWLDNYYPNPNGSPLKAALMGARSSAIQSWSDPRYASAAFDHPAEYLYEILARIDMDGVPALETLGTSCFEDTNGDGFLEVVDAWGEPMLWLIMQANVVDNSITNELYQDQATDWTVRDSFGMPAGYAVLDSTIPRDLQQIRVTVFSERMNSQGIYNTD